MGHDFGFGASSRKLDLSSFKVEVKTIPDIESDRVADRVAERAGFVSRESTERVMRERRPREPNDQLFVRAPISVMNRFKSHCNETGRSYGEALAELMNKAGI